MRSSLFIQKNHFLDQVRTSYFTFTLYLKKDSVNILPKPRFPLKTVVFLSQFSIMFREKYDRRYCMSNVAYFGNYFKERRISIGKTLRHFCAEHGLDAGNIARLPGRYAGVHYSTISR